MPSELAKTTQLKAMKRTRPENINQKIRDDQDFLINARQVYRDYWPIADGPAFVSEYLGFEVKVAYQFPGHTAHIFNATDNEANEGSHYILAIFSETPLNEVWVYRGDSNCSLLRGRYYRNNLTLNVEEVTGDTVRMVRVLRSEYYAGRFECHRCGDWRLVEERSEDPVYCQPCHTRNLREVAGIYNGEIREYHSTRRIWTPFGLPSDEVLLGVELEMYIKNDRETGLLEYAKLIGKHGFFERDGSLDRTHGVEVVYHPMTLAYAKEFYPPVLEKLVGPTSKCPSLAFDAPGGSYGIHVSVGRDKLSPMQEVRMQAFMYDPANKPFVQAIAQRFKGYSDSKEWGTGMDLKSEDTMEHLRHEGYGASYATDHATGKKKLVKLGSFGKYGAINMKPDVAEIRIFAATLKPSSFMKDLEFVDALCCWTSVRASTGWRFGHREFLSWITTQGLWDRYPNLLAYLQKYKFTIKGEPTVYNAWDDCIPQSSKRQGRLVLVETRSAA